MADLTINAAHVGLGSSATKSTRGQAGDGPVVIITSGLLKLSAVMTAGESYYLSETTGGIKLAITASQTAHA